MSTSRQPRWLLTPALLLAACTGDTSFVETSSESETSSASSDATDTDSDTSTTEDPTGDPPSPSCGDDTVDPGEECDDGNFVDDDGCTNACTLPTCGDGIIQAGEGCDTGPDNGPGQLCNSACQPNVCGDADPGPGESCDDGNDVDDDACPNNCVIASCGDGVVDVGEDCEDGNQEPGDGCTNACLFPVCGDGVVWIGHESCDDGNAIPDDECNNECEFLTCGDGLVTGLEECDDGNDLANDGCFGCLKQQPTMVATGPDKTCAVLDAGNLRCWGYNYDGVLGYANTVTIGDDEHPNTAGDVDVGGAVTHVSLSDYTICAVMVGGGVRCWGLDYADEGFPFPQIGYLGIPGIFHIGDDEPPSSVGAINVGGPAVQVGTGDLHTCALLETGAVRCWGTGLEGRLGYGNVDTIGDDEDPAAAGELDLGGVAVGLSVGGSHSCALLDTGAVHCWGKGPQLGYGNTQIIGDDETPADAGAVDVGGVVVEVAAGGSHTCARLDTGAVRCWGANTYGQLGYANTQTIGDDESPAAAGDVPLGGLAVQISAGGSHTCAVLESGAVRCWGGNLGGQLGYGNVTTIGDNETPASAGDVDLGGTAQAIAAGDGHTCAILTSGVLRCWGVNDDGATGIGITDTIGDNEPAAAAGNVQVF